MKRPVNEEVVEALRLGLVGLGWDDARAGADTSRQQAIHFELREALDEVLPALRAQFREEFKEQMLGEEAVDEGRIGAGRAGKHGTIFRPTADEMRRGIEAALAALGEQQ